jgi:hypothetical protein
VKGLWPTASARDWKSSASNKHGDNSRPLNEVVALWATPQAHDAVGAKTPEQIAEMRARAKPRKGGGPPGISNLNEMVAWPTPQSRDERGPTGANGRDVRSSLSDAAMPGATAGRLNPAWVSVLMGFPAGWLDVAPDTSKKQRK